MASAFFLLAQYEDVLIYLESIKAYFFNSDTFHYNFAQALAATGKWHEAEEAFLLIQSEALKADYTYLSWLATCCECEGRGGVITAL